MAAKKTTAKKKISKPTEAEIVKETETIVIFKAKKSLTQQQHEALADRIRFENKESGIKIILAPNGIEEIEIKEEDK